MNTNTNEKLRQLDMLRNLIKLSLLINAVRIFFKKFTREDFL
jgi:hypothetical protein